ncbi:hypothetical protein M427DRAFT_335623 [Gonapodya prolifera JEL478]|uniref:F-box domain-containing protein n=1 Tax=Gonapodya prolifera (strain JEL478) TaxID=1344416 RepID=A0A139ADP4_GONPJ|nr:hypothetical protein M427DRAFT_335623 [Gonapodya prolifera JEL478]|eukprot:KXS14878.1 hypothetical protein M427DRAFT_335623 [Gonapodya prolifera JEL478]
MSINTIPHELLARVLIHLNLRDLYHLSLASKRLHGAVSTDGISHFFRRNAFFHTPGTPTPTPHVSWQLLASCVCAERNWTAGTPTSGAKLMSSDRRFLPVFRVDRGNDRILVGCGNRIGFVPYTHGVGGSTSTHNSHKDTNEFKYIGQIPSSDITDILLAPPAEDEPSSGTVVYTTHLDGSLHRTLISDREFSHAAVPAPDTRSYSYTNSNRGRAPHRGRFNSPGAYTPRPPPPRRLHPTSSTRPSPATAISITSIPSTSTIATGSYDGTLRVHSSALGTLGDFHFGSYTSATLDTLRTSASLSSSSILTVPGTSRRIWSLATIPHSTHIAVGTVASQSMGPHRDSVHVVAVEPAGVRLVKTLWAHRGATYALTTPSPHTLTTAGYDGLVLTFDLRLPSQSRPVHQWDDIDDLPLFSLASDPEAQGGWCTAVGAGAHCVVRVYDRRGVAGTSAGTRKARGFRTWHKAPLAYSIFAQKALNSPVYSLHKDVGGVVVGVQGEVRSVGFWESDGVGNVRDVRDVAVY